MNGSFGLKRKKKKRKTRFFAYYLCIPFFAWGELFRNSNTCLKSRNYIFLNFLFSLAIIFIFCFFILRVLLRISNFWEDRFFLFFQGFFFLVNHDFKISNVGSSKEEKTFFEFFLINNFFSLENWKSTTCSCTKGGGAIPAVKLSKVCVFQDRKSVHWSNFLTILWQYKFLAIWSSEICTHENFTYFFFSYNWPWVPWKKNDPFCLHFFFTPVISGWHSFLSVRL